MICVSCMKVWLLSWELDKRNASLHAYIVPLAKHPRNLRISVQTCTDFLSNINDLNSECSVITEYFSSRSPQWWALDKENNEGCEISFLTSSAGYSQLIDQPTHITKESSSCIDLIFTSNPSFISASRVELSLYEKCHHNLIYGKINFNVPLLRPYIHEV